MEGQGAQAQNATDNTVINTPNSEYVIIFRDKSNGQYWGKLPNGTVELIGGGAGTGTITAGEATFAGGGTVAKVDPNALTTSLIVVTEHGVTATGDSYSYNVAADGTIDFYSTGAGSTETISYLIFN